MRKVVLWLALILAAGSGLLYLKFRVHRMEAELADINRQLLAAHEARHVLATEWTYLTRPERLARLNRRYLNLQPVMAGQLVDLNEIPQLPITASTFLRGAQ